MILFLGSLYPAELLGKLVERKQHVDFAAQTFQSSVLKGICEQTADVRVITSPVIRSKYSVVKDICKKSSFCFRGNKKAEGFYVGTVALPGLKLFVELFRVYSSAKKLLKKSNEKKVLMVYALHSPFLIAAVLLKKWYDISCVVVPDLPEYMSNGGSRIKRFFKSIDRTLINYCIKRLDCFVLLSPYMREKLPINGKPWVLMEGIYDEAIKTETEPTKCKDKVILYTGSLSERMGITDLIEAFKTIENPDYRLWFRGNGVAVKQKILDAQKDDSRIVYFDPMPKEQLRELQRKATVLVNPVKPSNEFTKYFFPSKTMEYLASGTPTIMYKLPCLPEDYFAHLLFVEDESINALKMKIIEVCEMPEEDRARIGMEASVFILKEKNAYVQTKKIIELINKVRKQ